MQKFKQEMETNDFIQAAVKCSHWFIAEIKAYDWSTELLTGTVSHFIRPCEKSPQSEFASGDFTPD